MNNKEIMSKNIKYYLDQTNLNVKDFAKQLGFKYTTVLDWVNGKTYPRIDKIEKMASYFGIQKADLVEEHKDKSAEKTITWTDLGMPFGGAIPEELRETYADIAKSYVKRHPEFLNKNGSSDEK